MREIVDIKRRRRERILKISEGRKKDLVKENINLASQQAPDNQLSFREKKRIINELKMEQVKDRKKMLENMKLNEKIFQARRKSFLAT